MVYVIIAILFGLFAGKIFALSVLAGISILCIIVVIYLSVTMEEIGQLITLIFFVCALVGNICMWSVYYITTNQSWLSTFFSTYIFR